MRAIVVTVSTAMLVLGTASASAGGGVSSFEFDDGYVVVGETVIGRATFYTDVRGTGRIENGPWYAYLMPRGRWIEAPRIPEGAIPLGQIAIEGRGSTALALITFTVPDVALGEYHVGVCNLPCTESMIGDLYGGQVRIARTQEGAALLSQVHDGRADLHRVRARLSRRVRMVQRPMETLTERVDDLEGSVELRLRELKDRAQTIAATDRQPVDVPWVTVGFAAAVVLTAGALLLRSRGRPRPQPVAQEPPVVEWELPDEVSART